MLCPWCQKNKIMYKNILTFLIVFFGLTYNQVVFAKEKCSMAETPANSRFKPIVLPKLRLAVNIPINYKAFKRSRTTLEIIDSGTYALMQCIARGGSGGRGYYREEVSVVPALTIKQAIQHRVLQNPGTKPSYYSANLNSNVPVTIVELHGPVFITTYAWFVNPQTQNIIELGTICDCNIDKTNMLKLLPRVLLLGNPNNPSSQDLEKIYQEISEKFISPSPN